MKARCFRTLLLTLLSVAALTGCSNGGNEDPTPPNTKLQVDQPSVTLSSSTPTVVNLTAPDGMSWEASSSALWMNISPTSGKGSAQITISYTNSPYRIVSANANVAIQSTDAGGFESTVVAVTGPTPANQAPQAPTKAIYPENGATDADQIFRLAWGEAIDPDGDKLTYIVEYSTDKTNWVTIGDKEGIKSTGYGDPSKLLNPSTTYYWRVTAWDMFDAKSAPSSIFSFTTKEAEAGTWKDGEARLYQENGINKADCFTLIVTGDGFTAADMAPGGEWEQASTRAIEGFFHNVEPYKTYRPYLRIWRIAAISNEKGISQKSGGTETACDGDKLIDTRFGSMRDYGANSAWCGLYDETYTGQPGKVYAAGKNPYGQSEYGTLGYVWGFILASLPAEAQVQAAKNCAVLVIQNIATYNGLVNYWDDGSNRTMGFVCRSTGGVGTQTGYENVVTHEIGGHAIGHLADEYFKGASGTIDADRVAQTKAWQSMGWYQNVDVSGSPETCPWSFFFKAKEFKSYYLGVDMFEGARSKAKGIWRPEYTSCMVDNIFHYNAPSRYSIVYQLKKAAGEELKWEDFVNKDYDRDNANTGTRGEALTPPDFIPLPEPVVWHHIK